jgi:hypothetical protein
MSGVQWSSALWCVPDIIYEIGAHLSPQDFLIDDKEFVEGIDWLGLNPTLPIYI